MNKYHARKTQVDGILFDSAAEARRYTELKLLERAGRITGLQRQVTYTLIPKSGHGRAIQYRADFVYSENGHEVIEDVKGVRTPVYKLKKRIMAELGHGITEVQ